MCSVGKLKIKRLCKDIAYTLGLFLEKQIVFVEVANLVKAFSVAHILDVIEKGIASRVAPFAGIYRQSVEKRCGEGVFSRCRGVYEIVFPCVVYGFFQKAERFVQMSCLSGGFRFSKLNMRHFIMIVTVVFVGDHRFEDFLCGNTGVLVFRYAVPQKRTNQNACIFLQILLRVLEFLLALQAHSEQFIFIEGKILDFR